MMRKLLQVKKLDASAEIPEYATDGSCAMDISSLYNYTISPGKIQMIKTGLAFKVPEGFSLYLLQRSGLSMKYPNYLSNCVGLIDSDYIGELMIIFSNNTNKEINISYKQRIAQIQLVSTPKIELDVVKDFDNAKSYFTSDEDFHHIKYRGTGGFGSTGEF